MRRVFLPALAVSTVALPLLAASPAAHAGTWENAFGNQDLDAVVSLIAQTHDAGQRQIMEQQLDSALQQEDARAIYVMGALQYTGVVPDIARSTSDGLRQIQSAAQSGIMDARVRLATLLLSGASGIDAKQTRQWLEQSASTSGAAAYADAQLWSQGLGGPANACRANQLLQIALQQNVNPDGNLQALLAQTHDACNGLRTGQQQRVGLTADDLAKIRQMSQQQAPVYTGAEVTAAQGSAAPQGGTMPSTPSMPSAPARQPAVTADGSTMPVVTTGVPQNRATYEMDLALARLAYAVYGTNETLASAQRALQAVESNITEVTSDQTLDPLIKSRELQALNEKRQSASSALETEQDEQRVRRLAEQSAQRVSFAEIETLAKAGHVYLEAWRLPDGHLAVVFRGTANSADIATDAQIGFTPEVAEELLARYKAASGQGIVTGTGELAVKGFADGRLNTQSTGRPEAFNVADMAVRSIIKSGVPAGQIVLAGHSLGGGYAQYAGIRNGVGTIVGFNPAPLNSRQAADLLPFARDTVPVIRYYVSVIPLPGHTVADPVSQVTSEMLRSPDMKTLGVIGRRWEYSDNVCVDFGSPAYQAFAAKAQGYVTKATFGTMGMGHKSAKRVSAGIGAADGYTSASNNQTGAAVAGARTGLGVANKYAIGRNCVVHPWLCSAAFAAGGLASAATMDVTPRLWLLLNAHSMRNLEASIEEGGQPSCAYSPGS